MCALSGSPATCGKYFQISSAVNASDRRHKTQECARDTVHGGLRRATRAISRREGVEAILQHIEIECAQFHHGVRGLPTFRTFFNGTAKKRFASWQEQPMGQGRSHLTRFFSVWFCMRMMWRRNMPVTRSLDEKDSRSAKRGCIR